jgi:hypothetical protein
MWQFLDVEYMSTHQKYVPVSSRTVHGETSEICQYLVVQYMMKHHFFMFCISRYWNIFWCVAMYSTTRYWHISDVSSCTVRLDTDTYFWYVAKYSRTRYFHIFLLFLHVLYNKILTHKPASSCGVLWKISEISASI